MANEIVIKPVVDPSLDKLKLLHPAIRDSAILAYRNARKRTPANVRPIINETYRSFEKQADYYAQGRTKKGAVITFSKPGQSFHQYRFALDFYLLIDGKAVWNASHTSWNIVVQCFKEQGFEAGIDWKGKKQDAPHLQKTFGLTWQNCLKMYKAEKFISGSKYLDL